MGQLAKALCLFRLDQPVADLGRFLDDTAPLKGAQESEAAALAFPPPTKKDVSLC